MNVQTVILWILWSHHGENLHQWTTWNSPGRPDTFQQQFGTLHSITPARFRQLLHASLLQTLQTRSVWTMRHRGLPNVFLSGNLAYRTMSVWLVFLTHCHLLHCWNVLCSACGLRPVTPFLPLNLPISCSFFRRLFKLLFNSFSQETRSSVSELHSLW